MLVSLCLLKQIQTFRLIDFSELKHNMGRWVYFALYRKTAKIGVLYGHVSSYTETFYKYVLAFITLFLKMVHLLKFTGKRRSRNWNVQQAFDHLKKKCKLGN